MSSACVCLVAKSCPTLCNLMDCSPPGSSVYGILQASILEWVSIPFSRGSFWLRNWTLISCVSCIAGKFFTSEPLRSPSMSQAWTNQVTISNLQSLFLCDVSLFESSRWVLASSDPSEICQGISNHLCHLHLPTFQSETSCVSLAISMGGQEAGHRLMSSLILHSCRSIPSHKTRNLCITSLFCG